MDEKKKIAKELAETIKGVTLEDAKRIRDFAAGAAAVMKQEANNGK